jgi:hypothetical protein
MVYILWECKHPTYIGVNENPPLFLMLLYITLNLHSVCKKLYSPFFWNRQ